ncbi:MAG: DUF2807 domain-containing protein [Candidatus Cloacimonetes bacterium]|nr:DUF2807 domain-containing protein [Candidatus Cloacimonadota bacterium]
MMNTLLILLVICIFSFCSILYADFTVEKELPIEEFQNLILIGEIDLYFTQSDEVSLILKAKDEKDFEKLHHEYRDKTLTIRNGVKSRSVFSIFGVQFFRSEGRNENKLLLYVNAPNLESIDKNNGGRIVFESGAVFQKLELKHSGGGTIDISEITIDELNVTSSGGGTINLSGTADLVRMQKSGGGRIIAENFIIKKANITTSGGGTITAYISEELDLKRSGGGSVNLSGTAENASIQTSGGGTINAENFIVKRANISTSGGGRITAHISEDLDLNQSGGGTVNLSGTAVNARINKVSGGRLNAGDFLVENASITLSGGVSGSVYVNELLDIQMSGGGRLQYRGNPRIRQNLSGDARLISEGL